MLSTKERILKAALKHFSQDGYGAASISQIATTLGLSKGALYKHYASKRALLNAIVQHLRDQDALRAAQFAMPVKTRKQTPQAYRQTAATALLQYSQAQFDYWTRDPVAAPFRKMLTLEQYRDKKMAALYQQYIGGGPLGYVSDLFAAWGLKNPAEKATAFYAPMFLYYSLYDAAQDKPSVTAQAKKHLAATLQKILQK